MDLILLTGGYGFLGKEIYQRLKERNYDVFRFRSNEYDLTDPLQAKSIFDKINPDYVIHAAARLGGIGDNQKNPAKYFETNMKIGLNVFSNCARKNVKKVLNIGTVCSYPKLSPVPFNEKNLWKGYPEETNSAYGISKRALFSYTEALFQQYNLHTVNVLLANLYGPGDDFRDGTSHVIPAIIKKINNAKTNMDKKIEVWGDGSPTRDFLNVIDASKLICRILEISNLPPSQPINIGTGKETSIKTLISEISEIMDYKGSVIYNTEKPNGQPRRVLDISRLKKELGLVKFIPLNKGLIETVDYYLQNKDSIDILSAKFN